MNDDEPTESEERPILVLGNARNGKTGSMVALLLALGAAPSPLDLPPPPLPELGLERYGVPPPRSRGRNVPGAGVSHSPGKKERRKRSRKARKAARKVGRR